MKEQPRQEILVNERFVKMRDGFLNGILVEDFCHHCSSIARFDKSEKREFLIKKVKSSSLQEKFYLYIL